MLIHCHDNLFSSPFLLGLTFMNYMYSRPCSFQSPNRCTILSSTSESLRSRPHFAAPALTYTLSVFAQDASQVCKSDQRPSTLSVGPVVTVMGSLQTPTPNSTGKSSLFLSNSNDAAF